MYSNFSCFLLAVITSEYTFLRKMAVGWRVSQKHDTAGRLVFLAHSISVYLRLSRWTYSYAICDMRASVGERCVCTRSHARQISRSRYVTYFDGRLRYPRYIIHKRCNRHAPFRSSLPLSYTRRTFVYGSRCIRSELKIPTARTRA